MRTNPITANNKRYRECPACGHKIGYRHEKSKEEFIAHKNECRGYTDPKERFEKGDRVTHSDYGTIRLKNKYNKYLFPRTGTIIGFSRKNDGCVRVQWDGNKTSSKYAHRFIKHLDPSEDPKHDS